MEHAIPGNVGHYRQRTIFGPPVQAAGHFPATLCTFPGTASAGLGNDKFPRSAVTLPVKLKAICFSVPVISHFDDLQFCCQHANAPVQRWYWIIFGIGCAVAGNVSVRVPPIIYCRESIHGIHFRWGPRTVPPARPRGAAAAGSPESLSQSTSTSPTAASATVGTPDWQEHIQTKGSFPAVHMCVRRWRLEDFRGMQRNKP